MHEGVNIALRRTTSYPVLKFTKKNSSLESLSIFMTSFETRHYDVIAGTNDGKKSKLHSTM